MRKITKNHMRIACFLTAFAAVGAGFAFRSYILASQLGDERESARRILLSDCAVSLEKLSESLIRLESAPQEKQPSVLSDIKLYSSLAGISLGSIELEGAGSTELFSMLRSVELLTDNALQMGISAEEGSVTGERAFTDEKAPPMALFITLSSYSRNIVDNALPYIADDQNKFEEKLAEVFSDVSLETILYESGYGALVPKVGFKTVGVGDIGESEAISIARKYLGKKAYLKATLSGGELPSYQLTGKNISALVSAGSGVLLQFLFDTPEGDTLINEDAAKEKASLFLEKLGFSTASLSVSEPYLSSGLYILEYTPVSKSGVLCLNEKIKVGVSSGSGRICLFDAVDYYRYHTKVLILPDSILSADEISSKYSLPSPPTLCKIERADGIESLCYRFTLPNTEIFVNALSGAEIRK